MDTVEEDVVVRAKTERILAIDLLRGFFLLVIMIDHVELYPNGWDFFTGKGRLWVSAAEGFFFLSGLLIGMIYKRRLNLGMKFIFKKMWMRAAELYLAGAALTFVFLSWVEFTHHTPIKDTLPSPIPWGHFSWLALSFRFTYGWADFLGHFAILMFFAPFIFFLVARKKGWLALVAMFVAWIYRGQSFNLAWQLIFNLGIIIGFYWQEIKNRYRALNARTRIWIKRGVATVAGVSFLLSYASVFVLSLLNHLYDSLSPWLRHLTFTWNNYNADTWVYADKWTMGPLRIVLFFAWFAVLYWIFRRYERQINRFSRGILELLGRNSLFVYICHAFIVFTLKMYFIPAQTNFIQNFLITGIGLAALIAITKLYKKLETRLIKTESSKLKTSEVFSR